MPKTARKRSLSYRRVILVILFCQICLIAFLTVFLTATYLPPAPAGSRDIAVPALVGARYCADDGALSPELFDVNVEYREDASCDPGTVLEQNPPANALRRVIPGKSRCPLRLTVSIGARVLSLPDLTGTDAREAAIKLREMGFGVTVEKEQRQDVSPGQVVKMNPPAGTALYPGEQVTLTESSQPTVKTVKVPSVVGMPVTYANSALVLRGLRPASTVVEESDREAGTVLSQRPLADTVVPVGTETVLVVSGGRNSSPLFPFALSGEEE